MGVLLMSMGLRDEAAACYEKAVAHNPTHSEAHNNLGVLKKARSGQRLSPPPYPPFAPPQRPPTRAEPLTSIV